MGAIAAGRIEHAIRSRDVGKRRVVGFSRQRQQAVARLCGHDIAWELPGLAHERIRAGASQCGELELIRIGAGIDRRQRGLLGLARVCVNQGAGILTGAQEVGVDAIIRQELGPILVSTKSLSRCRTRARSAAIAGRVHVQQPLRLIGTGTERNEARWRGAVVALEQVAAHERTISLQSVGGVPASKPPPPTAPVKTLSPRPSTTFPTMPLLVTLSISLRTASISVPASLPAPLSTSPTLPPAATVSTAWPAAETTGSIRLDAESPDSKRPG